MVDHISSSDVYCWGTNASIQICSWPALHLLLNRLKYVFSFWWSSGLSSGTSNPFGTEIWVLPIITRKMDSSHPTRDISHQGEITYILHTTWGKKWKKYSIRFYTVLYLLNMNWRTDIKTTELMTQNEERKKTVPQYSPTVRYVFVAFVIKWNQYCQWLCSMMHVGSY